MKKGLKIVLIIIGIIFLLLCILVGVMLYKDFKMEGKINREVEEIQNIMDATDFDEELFKKKINSTVATGDYYKVERAYKNYLRDYLAILNNIEKFYDDSSFEDILSMENFKADGKDFISSRIILNNAKEQLEKLKEQFDSMSTEKVVLSYLDSSLDSYYVDYYKRIVGDIKQSKQEQELSQYLADNTKIIENLYMVFEFLSSNKSQWEIENDNIVFTSEELLEQYKILLQSIIDTSNNVSNT